VLRRGERRCGGSVAVQRSGIDSAHTAFVVDDGIGDHVVEVRMRVERSARRVHVRRCEQPF